ncbi:MAG: DUF4336 domain-containing protein [Candidatus Acidiferrales bacterium]
MGELREFAKNVWIAEGSNVRDMGMTFTTRIVKLGGGSLWIDSPVTVASDTLDRVAALGPVKYLVAATPRHVWRLEAWHALFPQAQLWAARRTPLTLKHENLALTGVLTDVAPEGWAKDLGQLAFKGNPFIEEVIFLHRESRTVILDDLIQRHPLIPGKPLRNALVNFFRVAYPRGGVPLDMKFSFIRRRSARESLAKLLSWDFEKLIIAHGPCVEENAKAFVEQAFRWLGN